MVDNLDDLSDAQLLRQMEDKLIPPPPANDKTPTQQMLRTMDDPSPPSFQSTVIAGYAEQFGDLAVKQADALLTEAEAYRRKTIEHLNSLVKEAEAHRAGAVEFSRSMRADAAEKDRELSAFLDRIKQSGDVLSEATQRLNCGGRS